MIKLSEYFLVEIHLQSQTEEKINFLDSIDSPHFDELFSSCIWKPRFFSICNILTQCQTVLEFVVFALRELNEIYLIYEFLIFFRNKRKIDEADWCGLAWSCGAHSSVVCACAAFTDGDAVSDVDPRVAHSFSTRCLCHHCLSYVSPSSSLYGMCHNTAFLIVVPASFSHIPCSPDLTHAVILQPSLQGQVLLKAPVEGWCSMLSGYGTTVSTWSSLPLRGSTSCSFPFLSKDPSSCIRVHTDSRMVRSYLIQV